MSAPPALVPVEEYLRTAYEPDCDFVDGIVRERNEGDREHGQWQFEIAVYLRERRKQWNIHVAIETRMQVSRTRYRVPDICVFVGKAPQERIFSTPPFLCIEVLSPEDRMSRMQIKISDYLAFGVRYVWVFDPETRKAWIYTAEDITEVRDGVLRTHDPELTVPLDELFA
jgi:Uma2 family endonuclease